MKIILFIVFISLGLCATFGQETIYFDENGNKVNETKFRKKWGDKELLLTRWDSIGIDNKHYATLKKDLYMVVNCDYQDIKQQIEKIIKRTIPPNEILLLRYNYIDDLCNSNWDNIWTKSEIDKRNEFIKPIRNKLKKDNVFYIVLFDKGFELHNNPNSKNESFFKDNKGYFRKLIFTTPTLCGSYAIIKPNGQTLIRNGEYRADWMAQHLLPENWNLFFESKD